MTTARDGHLPSLGNADEAATSKNVISQNFNSIIYFIRLSPTNLRMVTHQKEVSYRLTQTSLTRLGPSDNCQEWSPTIPRIVTHQPKDGHPPEGSMLHPQNLALRLNSQDQDPVTTAKNGHLPSLGQLSTNLRMVRHQKEVFTHQKEVCYRLGIWH